jgi:hypothetical protein
VRQVEARHVPWNAVLAGRKQRRAVEQQNRGQQQQVGPGGADGLRQGWRYSHEERILLRCGGTLLWVGRALACPPGVTAPCERRRSANSGRRQKELDVRVFNELPDWFQDDAGFFRSPWL